MPFYPHENSLQNFQFMGHTHQSCFKYQFPVMRRLSISSGHAFLLVYRSDHHVHLNHHVHHNHHNHHGIFFGSIDDPNSLLLAQMRIEEIRQQRKDFKVKIHDFQTNTNQEILRRFRLSLLETKLTWGLKQERLLQKICFVSYVLELVKI